MGLAGMLCLRLTHNHTDLFPLMDSLENLLLAALEEDLGSGDITTLATVSEGTQSRALLVAKAPGVLSGTEAFRLAFDLMGAEISAWQCLSDGSRVPAGKVVASFQGQARAILSAERTAMNFVQHLSGVATLTAQFVDAVRDMPTRICDTRKTTPLLRTLEKKAVRDGGGTNHRFGLFDGILIKENHIAAAGGIREAVARARARAHHLMRVEVEVRDLEELERALEAGADVLLLDNMEVEQMLEAVARVRGTTVLLEASGNMSLERVADVAQTGVHLISVGALTHSAPVLDFSLLLEHA